MEGANLEDNPFNIYVFIATPTDIEYSIIKKK